MTTEKEISFIVHKSDDYKPISKLEKRRVTKLVMRQLFRVAARFDGSPKMEIKINFHAKGNA